MYLVKLDRSAEKQLVKLSQKLQEKIIHQLESLATDPFAPKTNLDKIKGLPHGYRLRIGNYRIIYELDTQAQTLTVWKISPRSAAYKA